MTPKKVQKDKHRSTKHTHKTKDRVTRTLLKTGVNSGASEGLRLFISTYNTPLNRFSQKSPLSAGLLQFLNHVIT